MSSLAQWTATQWTAAPSAALPPTPRTRRLIEHYEIGEAPRILGHGRYGPVIRARDVRTKRLVAIKVFDGSTLDEPARDLMRRQFATEAVALQRLSCDRHEGHVDEANAWACHLPACPTAVQQLLGYSHDGAMRPSQAEDGCCYLALELGDVTLAELGSAHLSAAEVRDAVQALFTTVAQLHGCGLVLARHSLHDFMRFGKTWKCIAAIGLRPVGWELSPSELSHLLFGRADGAPQPVDEATAVVPPHQQQQQQQQELQQQYHHQQLQQQSHASVPARTSAPAPAASAPAPAPQLILRKAGRVEIVALQS